MTYFLCRIPYWVCMAYVGRAQNHIKQIKHKTYFPLLSKFYQKIRNTSGRKIPIIPLWAWPIKATCGTTCGDKSLICVFLGNPPLQQSSPVISDQGCSSQCARRYVISGSLAGQMFATTWFIGSGVSRSSKVFTWTTFSCQRRVAIFLMNLSGAYLVTGTQMSRAPFLTLLAASHVFL